MNPVGEEGNMFSSLFDKVPAKRAGNEDDIAGAVLYLVSRAGVRSSYSLTTTLEPRTNSYRLMSMGCPFVLTVVVFFLLMAKSKLHTSTSTIIKLSCNNTIFLCRYISSPCRHSRLPHIPQRFSVQTTSYFAPV